MYRIWNYNAGSNRRFEWDNDAGVVEVPPNVRYNRSQGSASAGPFNFTILEDMLLDTSALTQTLQSLDTGAYSWKFALYNTSRGRDGLELEWHLC